MTTPSDDAMSTVDRLSAALDLAIDAQREFAIMHNQPEALAPELIMVLEAFSACDEVDDAPAFVEMLSHHDHFYHRAAMIALLSIGPKAIDALDAVLCHPDSSGDTLSVVAQVLFFMSDTWAFERIFEVLGFDRVFELIGLWLTFGPSPLEEDAGGRVLLTLRDSVAIFLERAVQDLQTHTPSIDLGVVSAMAALESTHATSVIRDCLARAEGDDDWFAVSERGLWALARRPVGLVLNDVLAFLDSVHHPTASEVLSVFGLPALTPTFERVVKWREDAARRYQRADAVRVVVRCMEPEATELLLSLFADEDILIRHMVWYALARRGEGVELLVERAQQGDTLDAPEAREALSQCPAPLAYRALQDMFERAREGGADAYDLDEYHYLMQSWTRSFSDAVH